MKKIKVGIIGTGMATSISSAHARGILKNENAELFSIYNLNREASYKWCDALGLDHCLYAESADELIEKCDAVIICTPNFTHTEYVCKVAAAGKNMLCEKPICSNEEEASQIAQALENYKAKGMVNMSYRCIPAIRMIREYIESGKCGKVYAVRHNMGGSRLANEAIPLEWRFVRSVSGSGALGDFGSHAFSLRFNSTAK